jgi:ribosome-associated protein
MPAAPRHRPRRRLVRRNLWAIINDLSPRVNPSGMAPVDSPPLIGRRRDRKPRPAAAAEARDAAPSKSQRKREMHALQDLGEALVALEPPRFRELCAECALPEPLVEAIVAARSITAWGARKRQLQYVGKLMREVDPAPIERRLASWAQGQAIDTRRQHALELWRERLLAEPGALDELAARHPGLDRPRFRALVARCQTERERGEPPRAFRELFRELKALDDPPTTGNEPR